MAEALDGQIAAALQGGSAKQIAALVPKVEAAASTAQKAATSARDRALDPSIDAAEVAAARRASEDAIFTAERLSRAAERLREALAHAQEAERQAELVAAYERARKARQAAADALGARYEALADEMAGLLEAAHFAEALIATANGNLPAGAPRLDGVEVGCRPGASAVSTPLVKMTVPAWRADRPAYWGPGASIGGGRVRTRPEPAIGDEEKAA